MDFLKKFGKNIAKYRKLRKLTQEQFAEKLGLALTTIAELETGKNFIKSDNLTKIVKLLDIEYKDLFDFDETPRGKYLNMINAKAKSMTVEQQKHLLKIMQTFD